MNDAATFVCSTARGDLWIVEGDLVRLDVEAIVSNDDVDGRMWTEVAHAIKQAGGEEVERLAREEAPRRTGQAWVTESGALPFEGIIHVASMDRRGESGIEIVKECMAAALTRAARCGFTSVGFAAIGSGPNAIDLETWLEAFAQTVVAHLFDDRARAAPRSSIVLALYEPEDFEEAVTVLKRAAREAVLESRRRVAAPASRGGW